MILETADQRSDDWYAARCGKATASVSSDAMATQETDRSAGKKPAAGDPTQAKDYLTELGRRAPDRPRDPEVHDCRHALGHSAGICSACRVRGPHGH
jgi:hypothetical protein